MHETNTHAENGQYSIVPDVSESAVIATDRSLLKRPVIVVDPEGHHAVYCSCFFTVHVAFSTVSLSLFSPPGVVPGCQCGSHSTAPRRAGFGMPYVSVNSVTRLGRSSNELGYDIMSNASTTPLADASHGYCG